LHLRRQETALPRATLLKEKILQPGREKLALLCHGFKILLRGDGLSQFNWNLLLT
jgi:hypothetical protein